MREAGLIVAQALELVRELVKPGATTSELDREIAGFVTSKGGTLAFNGYGGTAKRPPFPANICASVNDEVVHGIPGSRKLREGDIVSIDVGVKYRNYHGDAAVTLPVGRIAKRARKLLQVCRRALDIALEHIAAGVKLSTVARAVQQCVEGHGYSVVRKFVGHGIGREMHEDPQVPNFVGRKFEEVDLTRGMTLAVEPMINVGTHRVQVRPNGWTVVTQDRSLSAHFEHTVAVTDHGVDILTLP